MDLIDYKKIRPVAIWLYICSMAVFIVITIETISPETKLSLITVRWLQYSWVFIIIILYFIPFLLFILINRLPHIFLPSLFGFLLIGCAHWLINIYIGLDILLFGLMFNMALKLSIEPTCGSAALSPLYKYIRLSMIFLVVALFLGWSNLFTNYFYHQIMAILAGFSIVFTVFRSCNFQKTRRVTMVFILLGLTIILQVLLGLTVSIIPGEYYIVTMHRGMALLLLAMLIWAWHEVPHTDYSIDKNDK